MRNRKVTQAERKVPHGPGAADRPRRPGEDARSFAEQVRALGPEGEDIVRRLAIVNEFRLWEDCPRAPCRRVGKCRGEDVECFDERRGELKREILRHVVWLMCTANVSSDEFYDYLDEMTGEGDEHDDGV